LRAEDADILIVPGLGGSGPDHWQSRWGRRLKTARRVEQPDWDNPDRAGWKDNVLAAIEEAGRPVVLVAHSLGVVSAVDAAAEAGAGRIAAAFLVAPPDTERLVPDLPALPAFAPIPRDRLPFPAFLVASRSDPFCAFAKAEAVAGAWHALLMDAGDSGHLNEASGHGPWPEGLLLLSRLLRNWDAHTEITPA
jgi:predicted alpha/beta hydrolase family esterase